MKLIQFWQLGAGHPKFHKLNIDDEEYSLLANAREKLVLILDMEILYDQIIEECVETKSVMYNLSLRNISDHIIGDRVKGHNIRSRLNRHYFNLLNLSKLYLDKHFDHEKQKSFVKKVTQSDSLHSEVEQHRGKVFGTNIDYRLGCALRNYTQHYTLPVTTYSSGFNGHPNEQVKRSVFHIPLDKAKLSESKYFKKNLLSEYGETIDLHSVMDGYVKAISEMHMLNRRLTEPTSIESKGLLDGKIQEITDEYENAEFGLDVVCDSANPNKTFELATSWFDLAEHLKKKNRSVLDFKKFSHHPYKV